jgi:hypothetical protein
VRWCSDDSEENWLAITMCTLLVCEQAKREESGERPRVESTFVWCVCGVCVCVGEREWEEGDIAQESRMDAI